MNDLEGPRHQEARSALRVLGPVIMCIGLLFTTIGLGSFFAAFGGHNFGPPRYFWCAFIGLPLLGVGTMITKFAYFGAVARYIAGESAPVGKDVANYMVAGTRDSIRDVASAIGEGLSSSRSQGTMCGKCGATNDATAKFCRQCGVSMSSAKRCEKCGEVNDSAARFCDNCGVAIG